jgi:hypothetical protein
MAAPNTIYELEKKTQLLTEFICIRLNNLQSLQCRKSILLDLKYSLRGPLARPLGSATQGRLHYFPPPPPTPLFSK